MPVFCTVTLSLHPRSDSNHVNEPYKLSFYYYIIITAGVSAESFMQAFGLAQTAFNVQLASPQVLFCIFSHLTN